MPLRWDSGSTTTLLRQDVVEDLLARFFRCPGWTGRRREDFPPITEHFAASFPPSAVLPLPLSPLHAFLNAACG